MHVLDRQMSARVRAFVSKKEFDEQKRMKQESPEAQMAQARRIMRALVDAPSPFRAPTFVTLDAPNRPLVVIDSRFVLPPEARGGAIPEAPTRDVGGRRPDGREEAAPAAATLEVVVNGADTVVCLFRWDCARTGAENAEVVEGVTLAGADGRCTPSAVPRGRAQKHLPRVCGLGLAPGWVLMLYRVSSFLRFAKGLSIWVRGA